MFKKQVRHAVWKDCCSICRSLITFICFFDASEIPHRALWQNKSPEEKKSLSCLLLQSRIAAVRTGITQQWRSVSFLSKQQGRTRCFVLVVYSLRQHKEGQNLADDARMLTWRGDRTHTENWMSAVLSQTHTSIFAQAFHQEERNWSKLMRDDPM